MLKLFSDEPKIDILINNAGIAFHPFEKTKDGFELHFAVNYLGHFLLTLLLLPKLKLSDEGRVINTSAQAHHNGEIDLEKISDSHNFSSGAAFARSKLALVLMARTLATSWKGMIQFTIWHKTPQTIPTGVSGGLSFIYLPILTIILVFLVDFSLSSRVGAPA